MTPGRRTRGVNGGSEADHLDTTMARPMKHPLLLPLPKTNKGAYHLHHAPALVLPPISTLGPQFQSPFPPTTLSSSSVSTTTLSSPCPPIPVPLPVAGSPPAGGLRIHLQALFDAAQYRQSTERTHTRIRAAQVNNPTGLLMCSLETDTAKNRVRGASSWNYSKRPDCL